MQVDFSELIYPLIPVCFALLISIPGEDRYFERQAGKLCDDKNLDAAVKQYVAATSKGAVALHCHFEALTAGALNLIITFHVWPPGWRYVAVVITTIVYLLVLRNWIFSIFTLDLYQIATDSPPRKKGGFAAYTYAQELRRRESFFNFLCAASILVGWCLSQNVFPTVITASRPAARGAATASQLAPPKSGVTQGAAAH